MILDDYNEFADNVSVAAAAGTALIGDVIDLGTASPQRDVGNGEPIYLVVSIDTEVITAGAAGTIQFILASDAQAAIATDGSATVHFASRAFVTGNAASNDPDLNVGRFPVVVALPWEGRVYERYLGILATIGTTAVSAGSISAYLTHDPRGYKAYADRKSHV